MTKLNWRKIRIGDTGRVVTGRTPSTAVTDFFGNEYPFITPTDMNGDKNIINVERGLSQKGATLLSRNLLPPKSIIVSCIGWQMGKTAITNRPSFTNQQINAIIPNKGVNEDFLYYMLCTYQIEFKNLGSVGTRTPILNKSSFENVQIFLPPLLIQHKIADILSAYDDLIENNTRRIAILEEIAQSLYREWFVHFRFPGHEKNTMVESPLGMIPEGWEQINYSSLIMSMFGGDWGEEEPNKSEDCSVSIIRGADLSNLKLGETLKLPKRYISKRSLESRRLLVGDIIVENSVNASSRCIGKNLLITKGILDRIGGDVICASFCKVLRLRNPVLASIIHLHMQYLYDEGKMAFYQNVAANGIGNFQARRFLESEVIVIPKDIEDQVKMANILTDLVSSNYADRNANLRRTRDLLLPKLISGELDVEGLDIEVGDDGGNTSDVEPVPVAESEEAMLRQDRFTWETGDIVFS